MGKYRKVNIVETHPGRDSKPKFSLILQGKIVHESKKNSKVVLRDIVSNISINGNNIYRRTVSRVFNKCHL